MKIYQSRSFEKKVKKMSKTEKDSLDQEIRKIAPVEADVTSFAYRAR